MRKNEKVPELMQKCGIISKLYQRCVEDFVQTVGMHRAQHRMLLLIAGSSAEASQADYAKELNVSTAAVAVSLKKLEKDGYITRSANGTDTRRNNTVLTEKGRAILENSRSSLRSIDETMFERLSEEQLRVFDECLEIMRENLTALRDE